MQCLIKNVFSAINNEKCAVAIIVHIAPFDSSNEHLVTKKHMTDIFNLRPPKLKPSFVCDKDILIQISANIRTMYFPKNFFLKAANIIKFAWLS